MVIGGHDFEYSVITKIKQGVVQSKDSVRFRINSFLPGESLLYFAGRNSSLGEGWASYSLATGEKNYVASPTEVYLKEVAVDTVIFTVQDSTQLYAGYKGQAATRIFKASYPPRDLVAFGNLVYFRYENSFYSTDGTKAGTQLIKAFNPNVRFGGIKLSAKGVLLSVSLSFLEAKILLYEPGSNRWNYIVTTKPTSSRPVHFAEKKYLLAGRDFYYMDQEKQDSGFCRRISHSSFNMFSKTDYAHSKYYFCINNVPDTFNLYMVDTSMTIQRLNKAPLISYKDLDSSFHVASPLFTHRGELHYAKYTDYHLEVRRFTIPGSMGAPDMEQEVKLYPNPATNRVTLQCASQIESISVFTTQGRLCYSSQVGNATSHTLNVSAFPAGLYIVRFQSEGQSYRARFLKK